MAGVLDSARMASFIFDKIGCTQAQIVAPVIGGHGDDMVPLSRFSTVNGVPLSELLSQEENNEVIKRTKNAGAEIVSCFKNSSAYFAPAKAIVEIVKVIMSDRHKIVPCAVFLQGEYGYSDVVIVMSVELGINGAERIVELKLNEIEKKQFDESIQSVSTLINELKKLFLNLFLRRDKI